MARKKQGGGIEMKTSDINVNLNILPFGHVKLEVKGNELTEQRELNQLKIPIKYGQQVTTNRQLVEIIYNSEES